MDRRVLGIVVADGARQDSLAFAGGDTCPPALPFAGKYRVVDFVLSNLLNSGVAAVVVLAPADAHALREHVERHWQRGGPVADGLVTVVPVEDGHGTAWPRALRRAARHALVAVRPCADDLVAVCTASAVYQLDLRHLAVEHARSAAAVTVATLLLPRAEAAAYTTAAVDRAGRVVALGPTPADAPPLVPVCMGAYVTDLQTLARATRSDAPGAGALPLLAPGEVRDVAAYDFLDNPLPGRTGGHAGYWRDVVTPESYYAAQMELCVAAPPLDLYNPAWPLAAAGPSYPPALVVGDGVGRAGQALNSIVSDGCVLRGGVVVNSVLGRGVVVESGAEIEDSILFDGCRVGRRARIRRAIIDRRVEIGSGEVIGFGPPNTTCHATVRGSGLALVSRNGAAPAPGRADARRPPHADDRP
jgi:glucose-1-phosphate adenylyltransferase